MTANNQPIHSGGCLCGRITYTLLGDPGDFSACHCVQCRKASGTAFGANAGIDRAAFSLDDPQGLLREYASSPDKVRAFCGHCGSPLFARLVHNPDVLRVRLGTLDTPIEGRLKAHTFVSEKANWEVIGDAVPQFDQWASRDVLVQKGSKQP